jgi:phosphoglycerate dehydrogenase-like enzyme
VGCRLDCRKTRRVCYTPRDPILSNRHLPDAAVQRIRAAGIDYHYADNKGADPHGAPPEVYNAAIMALPRDVLRDARIIVNPAYHVTKQVMDAMPSLKWIQSTGAGINTGGILMTDWEEIDKRGIIVTTAKFHAPWISETVLGYMLVLGKDFLGHYEGQKKHQNTSRERGTRGIYLGDATALILGTGNIGGAIAKRARLGFAMKTVGVNSDGHAVDHFDETWPLSELDRLLPAADFVVLTLTLTEKTQFIINARNLPLMKKSAFLINISRGDLIVEDDLIRALRDKVIAGAALDVFHHEPLPRDSPFSSSRTCS